MKFDKPPRSLAEQVALLRSRGLVIDDEQAAIHYLGHLNYYRLSGYWLPLESSRDPHRFKPGARFDDVMNLYVFDRELRLLMLDAIERSEVSLRTQWAYHFAHHGGSHAYLDRRYAASDRKHCAHAAQLAADVGRSQELFISHYRNTYTMPDMPPVWSACELLSLGQLSRWYELLRPIGLRAKISATYGLDQQVLESVLHHLTYVRNLCAHHSRVWNRELTVTVALPKSKPDRLAHGVNRASKRKLYNSLCIAQHLMGIVAPGNRWAQRLEGLIRDHRIDVGDMGFPDDWCERSIWRGSCA
jgi:abortive infection bacteriophage resistance protein